MMSEWNRTDKSLPCFGLPVIACCRIYGRFIAEYEEIEDTKCGHWINRQSGEKGILPPTHWMYLPEPPSDFEWLGGNSL
jgi:hypothetical protein